MWMEMDKREQNGEFLGLQKMRNQIRWSRGMTFFIGRKD
jgi:hypothetical protein